MKIDIAAISLDVQNFRHSKVSTESEAIRSLLSDERAHKVAELAEDIVAQKGLDPSSLIIVANDHNQDLYIALEGNRRIAALKTLMTPDLAEGLPNHKTFQRLHQQFLDLNIKEVECVALDREQAAIWIKRKHYKGFGGAGVLAWNAVATARSDASEGHFSRWMTALAYLEEHGIDAEDIRERISSKTTTVERVLSSRYISLILGLDFNRDGTLTPENGDVSACVKLLTALMEEMSERDFVETRVSNANQQQAFIGQFANISVKLSPTSDESPGGSAEEDRPTNGTSNQRSDNANLDKDNEANQNKPVTSSAAGNGDAVRSRPVKIRKKLAKPGLRISNQPLNAFYSELRKLNVETNPHVAYAIIRVFVEKSSALFLEEKGIPPLDQRPGATWNDFGAKFKDKVAAVLNEVDPSSRNPELNYARDIANGNRDKLHTADFLNEAIHSHRALPSHSEIVNIWDRLHPYLLEIFQRID